MNRPDDRGLGYSPNQRYLREREAARQRVRSAVIVVVMIGVSLVVLGCFCAEAVR